MTKKEKIQATIFAVLLPIILLVWGRNLALFRRPSPADTEQAASADGGLEQENSLLRRARRSIYPTWGRDPFFVKAQEAHIGSYDLEGIIMDPASPFIIIDGEIKKEGDTVGGATIVSIQKTKVLLKKGDQEIVLELFQQSGHEL
jgi:hypothetical protein